MDSRRFNSIARTVNWRFAFAAVILGAATLLAAEFASLMLAEAALDDAAQAGAIEASLPRATRDSVAQVVMRRLVRAGLVSNTNELAPGVPMLLERNGRDVGNHVDAMPGDELLVAIGLDAASAAPRLSRWLGVTRPGQLLFARAVVKKL